MRHDVASLESFTRPQRSPQAHHSSDRPPDQPPSNYVRPSIGRKDHAATTVAEISDGILCCSQRVCVCDSKSLPICNFVATAHLATDSKYAVERFWKPVYLQRPRTASNCSSASQHLPCHYTPGSRSNLGDEEKLGRRASHKESCDIFNA